MSSDQDIAPMLWSSEQKIEILDLLPIGLLAFDKNGIITFANENTNQFGLISTEGEKSLIGTNLLTNNVIESFNLSENIKSLSDGESLESEVRSRKTIDGGFINSIIKVSPIFKDDVFEGGIIILEDVRIGSSISGVDISEIKNNYEAILYEAFDLLLILDLKGNVIFNSGKSKSSIILSGIKQDGNLQTIFDENNSELIKFNFLNSVKTRKESICSIVISTNDTASHYEVSSFPIFSDKKKIAFIVTTFRNVTSQISEIENLKRGIIELSHYQVITEASTDAIITVDKSGKIIFWNKSADKLCGYTRSQVFSKDLFKVLRITELTDLEDVFNRLQRTKSIRRKISFFNKKDEKRVGDFHFSKVTFDDNNEVYVILVNDITESEKIEQELKFSEERFRAIVHSASDLICNFDSNGKLLYTNPAFVDTLKISKSEIKRVKITDFFDPEFLEQRQFSIRNLIEAKSLTFELPVFTTQGEKLYLNANFSIVYDADDNIKFFNGIFKDITLRKNTEQELLLMRSIFDASNDGIAMELEGEFILANNSFANIFGYDSGTELIGKSSLEVVAEEDRERISKYSEARIVGEEAPNRYEFLGTRKDGSHFHIEVSVTYFLFNEKVFFVIIARDITERKRVQQAIKESEARYRSITENIDDFFWTAERLNGSLRPMFYTASVEKITGYSQADFLSDNRLFFKIIYPDDYGKVKSTLKKLFENYYKQADEIAFRIVNKHGNIVWVRNKLNLVRDHTGKVTKIFGLVSDISLQKKAEEELKVSTENLQKLNETKDRFISIISHDLRTPFSSILGFTDLLLQDDDLTNEERRQYITFIQDSSKTMLSLVNSLLDWTRLQTGRIKFEPEKTDIKGVIHKSFSSLSGFAIQKNISLIDTITSELYLFVDQNLLIQVFNNLVSNALKFTESGGTISIHAVQSEEARFIQISVKDNGVGIAKDNISKIFSVDSKFTSEGTAGEKGTGLGLSLVKEIIEKHGGKIWVESEFRKGTEFKFTLPKASASILLVDDSNTDRILYSKLIRSITSEYNVITATNGEEALEKIESAAPALVITDHTMPKVNGLELVNRLKSSNIKGKPPIIVLSGDLGKSEELAYSDAGIEYIFSKPVNLAAFKDAVEKSMKKLPMDK